MATVAAPLPWVRNLSKGLCQNLGALSVALVGNHWSAGVQETSEKQDVGMSGRLVQPLQCRRATRCSRPTVRRTRHRNRAAVREVGDHRRARGPARWCGGVQPVGGEGIRPRTTLTPLRPASIFLFQDFPHSFEFFHEGVALGAALANPSQAIRRLRARFKPNMKARTANTSTRSQPAMCGAIINIAIVRAQERGSVPRRQTV